MKNSIIKVKVLILCGEAQRVVRAVALDEVMWCADERNTPVTACA